MECVPCCESQSQNCPLSLAEFLARLDALDGPVAAERVGALLLRLNPAADELASHEQFDAARYRRNTVREATGYQVLVLCWRPGQRSPVHNHAGSACGVRILKGTAAETLYDVRDPDRPLPTATRLLRPGAVTTSFDRDAHRITALVEPLVTLHVYNPPLRDMTVYPDGDGPDERRVREFVDRLCVVRGPDDGAPNLLGAGDTPATVGPSPAVGAVLRGPSLAEDEV